MNKSYVIQWKSTVNGRAGRGTKQFQREEAEKLVTELNREYPQIIHEVVEYTSDPQPTGEHQEEQHAISTSTPVLSIV
jgi:predicted AAA+ superfamily ATPase